MTKTRLNQHHRQLLRDFAEKGIACPREQKVRDKAYVKAARLVSETAERLYPATEMAVLAKYNVAKPDACVRGGAPDGRFIGFEFDGTDTLIPVLPSAYCGSRSFAWTAATGDAIEAFDKAADALKKARAEKLRKYRALILTARTFEEVLSVWPAVVALRETITRQPTALVALSEDVAAFIREDNAGALAEAA